MVDYPISTYKILNCNFAHLQQVGSLKDKVIYDD